MLLNYWKNCTQELGRGEGAGLVGFHLFFTKHTLKDPSSLFIWVLSSRFWTHVHTAQCCETEAGSGPQLLVLQLPKLIMQHQRQCLPSQHTGFEITQRVHQTQDCSEQKGKVCSALSGSEENGFNAD